jgi:SAM-dependent methyltransferase
VTFLSDQSDLRADREKTAFDNTDVLENSLRLKRRFMHVFQSPNTMRGELALQKWTASVSPNASILEYGCGDGAFVPILRSLGAKRVIGVDISERSIAEARTKYGNLAEFYCCNAERLTMLEDSSVDAVIGRGILHHLNFTAALNEVSRVLRTGGSAFFVEPLYDNPASIVFRKLTPKARTDDERPLSRRQIVYADRLFTSSSHCFCNLVTTPIAMLTSQLPLKPDNAALKLADWVDQSLARTPLRYWMRMAYMSWVK